MRKLITLIVVSIMALASSAYTDEELKMTKAADMTPGNGKCCA